MVVTVALPATALTPRTRTMVPRPRHRAEANMVVIAVVIKAVVITNKHLPRHNGGTLEVEVEVDKAEAPPSRPHARTRWAQHAAGCTATRAWIALTRTTTLSSRPALVVHLT